MDEQNLSEPVKGLELKLRIDFADLDLFGHVNNISFLKYLQSGRIQFWEKCGMMDRYFHCKEGPILHTTQCRYVLPLFYPGEIRVFTCVQWVGRTSFGMEHVILNQQGQVAAVGSDIFVMYDFINNQKVELEASLRGNIELVQQFQPDTRQA